MNKTGIEWCDYTWNPITGCKHGCEYCYAARMCNRFSTQTARPDGGLHDLTKRHETIYPYGFDPTFHRYRLNQPKGLKKAQNVFVCSMADMFGEWVPDEWIQEVLKACEAEPRHRYLFLTKNPKRYVELYDIIPKTKNIWLGTTATDADADIFYDSGLSGIGGVFISAEPLMGDISERIDDGLVCRTDWVIVGAETGNRKDKVIPIRDWLESIAQQCFGNCIPLFMKNSLASVWGEPLIQEFPW